MKKTLNIHLGRQLFTIEEDAYDRLQEYLAKLTASLNAEDGIEEIIEDIEMRFAELLLTYLGENRKVVGIEDVEKGIASLGEPDEISEESNTQQSFGNTEQQKSQQNTQQNGQKRLFRDTQEGVIAGVATGLANYINIDPVIVRVLFVVSFFMGFGFFLYLLLWIAVPSVKTPSDRLQMQGKPVTVDTLKEEFEKAAGKIKSETKLAAQRFKNNQAHLVDRTKSAARTIGKLIGVAMIVLSLIFLTIFTFVVTGIIDVFPVTGDQEYASLFELLTLVCPVEKTLTLSWIGILLVGFCGALLAISIGTRLFIGRKLPFLTINLIVFPALIVIGMVCGIIGIVQTARDYEKFSEIENQHIAFSANELYVDELPNYSNGKRVVSAGGINFVSIEHNFIGEEGVTIKYRPSKDSLFHIRQDFSAHGFNLSAAKKRSTHIQHIIKFEKGMLFVDPGFRYPVKDGFRDQDVTIIIEVPNNKNLFVKNIKQTIMPEDMSGRLNADEPYYAESESDWF